MRTRFLGVASIVRFNWPFYVDAVVVVVFAFPLGIFLLLSPFGLFGLLTLVAMVAALYGIGVSLFVSWWVYDRSDLYWMRWLESAGKPGCIVNINAGFDETSEGLRARFPDSELRVWDFFDAKNHTEPSIRRARDAYPPDAETELVSIDSLPMEDGCADAVCLFMAAHEIREHDHRVEFFCEVRRILRSGGKVFVTEHLRDLPNALAYTVGVLHFHSRKTWLRAFERAGLVVVEERKTTPFVSTFVLEKAVA